ncbi:GumC family protein [Pantanalinema rosaneae CENA516]|uniref:GumC family protein n=1 Tax=Pantanalinema rosaneae TaxID=1620701 RepID=UPI003D6DE15B
MEPSRQFQPIDDVPLPKPAKAVDATVPVEPPEEGFNPAQIMGMVRRKAPIIAAVAIAASAFSGFQASRQTPLFQSTFALLVEPVTQRKQLSKLTDGPSETTKELDYSTQIEVMFSPKTLEPMIKAINNRYPDVNYEGLSSKLSVNRLGETKIIEVGYSGTDPAKVKYVLEKLSQGYLKHSLEEQKATLRQGIKFVDHQLPALQKRVADLQQQIQTLRQQYNFVDPDTYAQQLSGQLGTIAQQRQTLQTEMVTLRTRYDTLQQQMGVTATLSNASFYQEFLQQFQALDRQIAIESARFGDKSPTIKMLRQQQENLVPLLQNEAKRALDNQIATLVNDMQVVQKRDQTLFQTEQQLKRQFQQTPILSRQYTDLQRELKSATESLQRFSDTRESLEIQAAQNELPWQLITPPKQPDSKVASNVYKSLMTGAAAGLGLGVAIAFLLEKLQSTFFTIADLRKKTKLPILGVIPFRPDLEQAGPEVHVVDLRHLYPEGVRSVIKDVEDIKTRFKSLLHAHASEADACNLEIPPAAKPQFDLSEQDSYGFIEAFRALYASLEGINKQSPLRSLVISSALPVEGRTTVAVHLAQAAAALGKRVLLVDAHLRSGSVQVEHLFGLPFTAGLSNLLREETTLEQVIQRLDWELGLFVVAAGTIPPDPTRLLASNQMKEFMQRVHKTFDLVIYDTLPLMGLADVSLIAAESDGVILVTGFGKWHGADAFNQTVERLRSAQIPVLGVVANGVKNYSVDLYSR